MLRDVSVSAVCRLKLAKPPRVSSKRPHEIDQFRARAVKSHGPEAVVQSFLDIASHREHRDVDRVVDLLADEIIDAGIQAFEGTQCAPVPSKFASLTNEEDC